MAENEENKALEVKSEVTEEAVKENSASSETAKTPNTEFSALSDRELLIELLKEQKKASRRSLITAASLVAICLMIGAAVLIIVPRVNATLNNAYQAIDNIEAVVANADKAIGIVESEKSAVICSLCIPNLLWMATGSKGNLQEERLSAIKDRNSILFPDTDKDGGAYRQWMNRSKELNANGWHLQVSDYLERVATIEQRVAKIDIADLLIDDLLHKQDSHSAAIADTLQGESYIRREQVYVLSDSKPMLPTDDEHSASRWSHLHI